MSNRSASHQAVLQMEQYAESLVGGTQWVQCQEECFLNLFCVSIRSKCPSQLSKTNCKYSGKCQFWQTRTAIGRTISSHFMSQIQSFALATLQAGEALVTVMKVVRLFVMVNCKVSPAGEMDVQKVAILVYIHKSANSSIGSKWQWHQIKLQFASLKK